MGNCQCKDAASAKTGTPEDVIKADDEARDARAEYTFENGAKYTG